MTSDDEFRWLIRSFEAGTLPRPAWTHRAHLAVALWYSRGRTEAEAFRSIRRGILAFNDRTGNPTGYHETITRAWTCLIARFLARHDRGQSFTALVGALWEECGDRDHLLRYYSRSTLFSDEARHGWVEPDRRPFEEWAPVATG